MVGGRGGVGGGSGSGGGNRAEADRWLVTSEKLLASSDLQGARTFAIRACETDPTRAEAADYILAICDILLAGETRLGDSNLPDWYAVLRLGRLAQNPEHVATQYRRLALLLNPSVNRLPFADRAFKVVADAWYVLSDPSKKSLYDRELQLSQLGQSGFQPQSQAQQQQFHWKPSYSTNAAQEQPYVYPPPQSQAGTSSNPMATSFWTACPYCFALFEYPKVYEECTLKCQECRRAFQAVTIEKPPVEGKGEEDVYFCSWALFPLGHSGEFKTPSWSPISPLFACPLQKKRKEPAPPRIYYEDDDIYVAISDDDCEGDGGNDDDEDDWQDEAQANKKANVGKGKETSVRSNKKHGAEKAGQGFQNVESTSGARNPAVSIASDAMAVCSSSGVMSKPVSYSNRKRMGAGAKNLGRLDLNVEFSNEVEEPAVAGGRSEGSGLGSNRDMDNMEGIGFFEGLDEFLNSLPILSVVGDDKIKAT